MAFNYWQKFEEGGVYHIYNRTVQHTKLFREKKDYLDFLSKYKKYFSAYFSTYAYCLIPNHFHLLIRVKPLEEVVTFLQKENTKAATKVLNEEFPINYFLEDQMRRFFSSIALRYNKKYSRRGPLFSEKFKRIQITSESKVQHLLCYIHHNPIHHKLTTDYKEWKYSSYNAYLLLNQESLVEQTEIVSWLGRVDAFLQIHEDFKALPYEMFSFDNI